MKKVLLTSAVVLTAFGAYSVANAEDVTVPSLTANTSTYVQTLKQKIAMVKSGYPYRSADGTVSTANRATAEADAASLQNNVEQVQTAITALTKLQNEYKVLYTKYHNALTERQEREAKQDGLAKAVGVAKEKLDNLLYDQQGSTLANTALKDEYKALMADVTNTSSIAYAYQQLTTKREQLATAKEELAKYKAENVTELASNYQEMVTAKTAAVNTAQLAVDEAEKEHAKRSARAESLENDILFAENVDDATRYAVRQASRELRVANKAQAENDGKLVAVIKLVNEPATGLQARLTKLKDTAAVDGSIKHAQAELDTKVGQATAAFATVEAHIAALNPADVKRVGLKLEVEKLADAVKAVLATETPDVPATPATPAKAAWVQSGSSWWYKHADGSYTTNGWEKINGTWYYFDQAGWMQTGWVKDGNTWYYLKDNGAMATGWVKDNGTWYYLKDNGAMATGWYKVGDKWYYSYASGALAVNTTVDGYTVNGNGEWV